MVMPDGTPFAIPADMPAPAPLALAVLVTVLLRSLSAYWAHRASHRIGWLWRLHRVHHSDTGVDATTGFRHHPVEQFVSFLCALPAIWRARSAGARRTAFMVNGAGSRLPSLAM